MDIGVFVFLNTPILQYSNTPDGLLIPAPFFQVLCA